MAHHEPSAPLEVTTVIVPPETVNFGSALPIAFVENTPQAIMTEKPVEIAPPESVSALVYVPEIRREEPNTSGPGAVVVVEAKAIIFLID